MYDASLQKIIASKPRVAMTLLASPGRNGDGGATGFCVAFSGEIGKRVPVALLPSLPHQRTYYMYISYFECGSKELTLL